jgi:hypothetical protein
MYAVRMTSGYRDSVILAGAHEACVGHNMIASMDLRGMDADGSFRSQ